MCVLLFLWSVRTIDCGPFIILYVYIGIGRTAIIPPPTHTHTLLIHPNTETPKQGWRRPSRRRSGRRRPRSASSSSSARSRPCARQGSGVLVLGWIGIGSVGARAFERLPLLGVAGSYFIHLYIYIYVHVMKIGALVREVPLVPHQRQLPRAQVRAIPTNLLFACTRGCMDGCVKLVFFRLHGRWWVWLDGCIKSSTQRHNAARTITTNTNKITHPLTQREGRPAERASRQAVPTRGPFC